MVGLPVWCGGCGRCSLREATKLSAMSDRSMTAARRPEEGDREVAGAKRQEPIRVLIVGRPRAVPARPGDGPRGGGRHRPGRRRRATGPRRWRRPANRCPTSCSWTSGCRRAAASRRAAAIKEVAPSAKIVMLTISDEEEDLFEAIRAGASGYLLKDIPLDEVAEAVRGGARRPVPDQPLDGGQAAQRVRHAGQARHRGGRGAARRPAQAHRPRDGGAQAGRPRHEQPRHRQGAVHLGEHGEEPRAGTSWRSCRSTPGWKP